MCSSYVVERAVWADIATKVEIRLGLRRLVLDLKLIHCGSFGFKNRLVEIYLVFVPLAFQHDLNIADNCLAHPLGDCQRCTGSPTCVPHATRVTSLPSCKTSACERGMV